MEFNGGKWPALPADRREEYVKGWRQEPEHPPRFSEGFLKTWRALYDTVIAREAPAGVRAAALSDYISCKRSKGVLMLFCAENLKKYIEERLDAVKPILWPYMQSVGCKQLNYVLPEESEKQ